MNIAALDPAREQIERDAEGYLMDPEAWDEAFATQVAHEENLMLTEDYWPILRFMRHFYETHRVAPDVRHVVGDMAHKQGLAKKAAKEKLFRLFPYGYVKQACKMAGMRKPRAWSTG